MVTIYADGKRLNTPSSGLTTASLRLDMGKAGSLNFTLQPSHYLYDSIRRMKTKVRVLFGEEEVFSGRVYETTVDTFKQKSVYCEGNLAYLLDAVMEPGEFTGTVSEYFAHCIDAYNSQVESNRQFEVGYVDIDEASKTETFKRESFTDVKSAIDSDLINIYGGYLWVRSFSGVNYIDYVKDYERKADQPIKFGVNLIDLTEKNNSEDTFSVLIPVGPDHMTIESVNGGSKELEDEEATEVYGGRIVRVENFNDAESPSDLLEKGKKFLEEKAKGIPPNLTIKAIDLRYLFSNKKAILPGYKVEVESVPHGISGFLTCISAEYDLLAAENNTYELGTPIQSLTQRYTENRRSVNSALESVDRTLQSQSDSIQKNADNININANNINVNANNISINSEKIEVNASKIDVNATKIAALAEEILLRATSEDLGVLRDRLKEAEIKIDGNTAEIALRAKQVDLEYIDKRVTEAEWEINGGEGIEGLKVQTERLFSRMHAVEIDLDGGDGEIGLKAVTSELYGDVRKLGDDYNTLAGEVSENKERVSAAEIAIKSAEAAIELKASVTQFNDLSGRVQSAEATLSVHADQISTKVSAGGIASAINQTAQSVLISASKINLDGYVTVSDLSAVNADIQNLKSGNTTAAVLRAGVMTCTTLTVGGSNVHILPVTYISDVDLSISYTHVQTDNGYEQVVSSIRIIPTSTTKDFLKPAG